MSNSSDAKALRSGVWYTLSNFLLQGIAFITTPIFTRLMTKSDFGSFSNYTAWLSIVAIVCTLEFKSSVSRAYYDFTEDFDGYLSSITFLGTLITAGFYALVLIFRGFFESLLGMDFLYINIMFLNVLFAPALEILQAKHRIQLKYKAFVAVSIATTLSSTLLSVLLVTRLENRLAGRIVGQALPLIIAYVIAFILVISRGRTLYNKDYWKYALVFSAPIVPHLLSNTLLGSSDKVMITAMAGSEANAIYSLAYSCGMIISVLFTSMNQAWVPWLFEKLHEEDHGTINKVSKLYLAVFMIMLEGAVLLAPELMLIMGGRSYEEATAVVAPIMLGYGFKFAYTFYVNIEQYEKKTYFISVGTIVAAVINIVLNLIFIPRYGYAAAAYTTLAGYIILMLLHLIFCRKILKIAGMYDNVFILIALGLMTVAGLASQLLYNNTPVRYVVITILAVLGVVMLCKLARKYRKLT